ncbi:MAG: hypothetical protein JRD68_11845, partial [Deltaproteobacteria bacterium]|nr:hypothetical protein [Deltaproteobacteria bacterium]
MDFYVTKYLGSAFTPELNIGNVIGFLNLFQDKSGNLFDGQITSLPISQGAPVEIPRLIIESESQEWKLQLSLQRIDVFFYRKTHWSSGDEIVSPNEFIKFCIKIFSSFKSFTNTRLQRLAYVTERVGEIQDGSPSQYIANRFCKEEYLESPFNNTKSFEIHSLKK